MTPLRRKAAALGISAIVLGAATACGAGLESLPLPAPSVGSSYSISATFANALNLPTRAKVKLAGADVGEVQSMTAHNYTAIVRMKIKNGVELPFGTTAELRSATPLGDVYVAVKPPATVPSDGARLVDGASIPLASTTDAATIESVLTTASLLVNGGAIRSVTKLVNGLGAAVGGKGDKISQLISQATQLVHTLAARSDDIRSALADTQKLTASLSAQTASIKDVVAAAAPALAVVAANTNRALDLIKQVDAISRQLAKFPSIQGTDVRSTVADINHFAAGLNDAATDPDASLDAVNKLLPALSKTLDSTSAHLDGNLADITIGALPDWAHPGDPTGSRLPDVTDWARFVGTIEYDLAQLKARVTGPGR